MGIGVSGSMNCGVGEGVGGDMRSDGEDSGRE